MMDARGRAGVTAFGLLTLLACGPVVILNAAPSAFEQRRSYVEGVGRVLPVHDDDAFAVMADTRYSARLRGQLVWLDLRHPDARERLGEVAGPISLRLDASHLDDPLLRRQLRAISEEQEVEIDLSYMRVARHDHRLSRTKMTDSRLRHLGALTQLSVLDLSSCELDDRAFDHLSGLRSLRSLDLSGNRIRGPGLARLRSLAELEHLDLAYNYISDGALGHLGALTALRELRLDRNALTDAGLQRLRALPELRFLSLRGNAITDEGVTHLLELEKLEVLYLRGTQVSEQAAARIRRASPSLYVLGP